MYFNFQIVGTLSIVIADDIGRFIRFIFFYTFLSDVLIQYANT